MPYTVTVSARNLKLKEQMILFLQHTYRPWPVVMESPGTVTNFKLCKSEVGFEFDHVSDPEREYHYSIMRWVAIQIGKRRKRFRLSQQEVSVPYLLLNGSESKPILLEDFAPMPLLPHQPYYDNLGMRVDVNDVARELAWYHIPDGTYERVSITLGGGPLPLIQEALIEAGFDESRRILRVVRAQLTRLDELWELRLSSGCTPDQRL